MFEDKEKVIFVESLEGEGIPAGAVGFLLSVVEPEDLPEDVEELDELDAPAEGEEVGNALVRVCGKDVYAPLDILELGEAEE